MEQRLNKLIEELFQLAGIEREKLQSTKLIVYETQKEEYYNVSTPLTVAATSVISALGVSLGELWKRRELEKDESGVLNVEINMREVAANLSSYTHAKQEKGSNGVWGGFTGIYQCKDGRWLRLHCNYDHHNQNVLRYLQLPSDATIEQVKEKLLQENAERWEELLTEAECCVAMVRTKKEWLHHPQGVATSQLKLFTMTRSSHDSHIISHDKNSRLFRARLKSALEGIRVLELSRVIAGPVGCKLLAQYGADVLKISAPHLPDIEGLHCDTNIGKKCAYLDLRLSSDVEELLQLVKNCDVFFQAYRPGSLARRGISYQSLSQINPNLIYVSLSAYSENGPWHSRRGYDTLVQCATGIADTHSSFLRRTNNPPSPNIDNNDDHHHNDNNDDNDDWYKEKPSLWPVQAQDYISGYLVAFAVTAALLRQSEEGGGYHVRISLSQTGFWLNRIPQIEVDRSASSQLGEYFDVSEFMCSFDTSCWGKFECLRSPIGFNGVHPTPSPPLPLGSSPPSWW